METGGEISLATTGVLPALIADYLNLQNGLKHLYKYTPQTASFAQAIADKQKDDTDRALLVEVLRRQYAVLPAHNFVNSNIDLLLAENTFTVTTAHQPCLLLGPLYNIYKIASTIHLARSLKQAYPANNFVPVFWLGSEDHDIEELNHIYLNGQKFEWQQQVSGAIGRVNAEVVREVLQQLKAANIDNGVIHIVEAGLAKYETFGTLSQYLVHEVFKEHGLVVLNQDDRRLKHKFAAIIEDEILNGRGEKVLADNVSFLQENYKAQAIPREINFFYLGDGYRERIVWSHERQLFTVNGKELAFTADEIKQEIAQYPERFSPNVIFRPVYQEMVLPNLAFVGGAGELSYWLELKPLFDYYKLNYPLLALRGSAMVVNAPVQNKLQKLNLQPADFLGDIEVLIKEYVKQNAGADTSLTTEKQDLAGLYEQVLARAKQVDATLENNVAAEKQKALQALENIEGKMLKAEKRKQETAVNQLRAVHAALMPNSTLQERVENFMPYYSAGIVNAAVENLDPLNSHLVVFINQ